jgi:hypothetical protein
MFSLETGYRRCGMAREAKLIVEVVSGHVVVENEKEEVVVDFPCKSSADAIMLKASLTAHVVGAIAKEQYISRKLK